MATLRGLMSGKVRSNAGCWTCRLRRKKCDERHPECEACRTLEITCHYGDEKPAWMDGGARQKAMADSIKAQVRRQAGQRRDRKYMELLEVGTSRVHIGRTDAADDDDKVAVAAVANGNVNGKANGNRLTPGSSSTASGSSPPDTVASGPQSDHQRSSSSGGSGGGGGHQPDPASNDHFIMIYLDYVFPYLFPFYRPLVLSGGRGWVLQILNQHKTVLHTAISLASYFFGVMLSGGTDRNKDCVRATAETLQNQLEMGLRELRREMCAMNRRPGGLAGICEQMTIMMGIVQMAIFEVSTGNGDNWKMHLDAALTLFSQILPGADSWPETLDALDNLKWVVPPVDLGPMGPRRPWSTNQAALRFFGANLIHMDVMSSVVLERPPRLLVYRDTVIPSHDPRERRVSHPTLGPILMEEYVGIQNGVVHIIGDVATLDAWKKEQSRAGALPGDELVSRGKALADALVGMLSALEDMVRAGRPQTMTTMIVGDPMPRTRSAPGEFDPSTATHSRIWIYGVLAYLHTVVLGWQPSHPDIRLCVCTITQMLGKLPDGFCVQGIVFPFCVAGCLCPPGEEAVYRDVVNRLGHLRVFGTMKEASRILEKVWASRADMDEGWDVARCLSILGHRSLLI